MTAPPLGAGGGTRTHTMSPSADFESATSTIPSHRRVLEKYITCSRKIQVQSLQSLSSAATGINIMFISAGTDTPGISSVKLYCQRSTA